MDILKSEYSFIKGEIKVDVPIRSWHLLTASADAAVHAASSGVGGEILSKVIVLFILILVNAFFAMSEIAIISLNDTKMQRMAEEGNKKAKQVCKLTENSSQFLSTIQIGVTLAGFLTSATAASSFVPLLSPFVESALPTLSPSLIESILMILITIVISYFSLVLGELAPKRIGMIYAEKVSFKVIGILLVIAKITKPFVKVLAFSTNLVARIFGVDPDADEEEVTEEEIMMMVDVGEEKGVIEDLQRDMINNIFEFDDINAADIMTHRVDLTCVSADEPLDEFLRETLVESGYSRIPVYEDDLDSIIGILYVKDLIKYIAGSLPEGITPRQVMREAFFVPESKPCGGLFREMTDQRIQIAVVVDEYGGTAGIVTLEDLLESIVGNIRDEYDFDEEEEINQINETTFDVDGSTSIDELDDLVGVKIPEGDYDTVAGFVLYQLKNLPVGGEMFDFENLHFTVTEVEERRICSVKIEILPKEEPEEEEERPFDRLRRDREKDSDKN